MYIITLLFSVILSAYGQSNWDTDFDSQWVDWYGDTSLFRQNTAGQWQLNDTVAGEAVVYTNSTAFKNARWDFTVELDFSPSSANNISLVLMADKSRLLDDWRGYFIRIGGNASNTISFMKRNGETNRTLVEGRDQLLAATHNRIRIVVERDSLGFWRMYSDTSVSRNQLQLDATIKDDEYKTAFYFGMICRYTATRSNLIYFDEIHVTSSALEDSILPKLHAAQAISADEILLRYDRPISRQSAENTQNYTINEPDILIQQAKFRDTDPRLLHLQTSESLQTNKRYEISIQNLENRMGLQIPEEKQAIAWFEAREGDLLINEIMANPEPVVGLPPHKYFELYNRTDLPISLSAWSIQMGNTVRSFPDVVIAPDSFMLFARPEAIEFYSDDIAKATMDFPLNALPIGGTSLYLFSPQGKIIHQIAYTQNWYRHADKAGGGWSLEQIDHNNTCGGASNWGASVDVRGGSPGRRNSIFGQNPDTSAPSFQFFEMENPYAIRLYFTEKIEGDFLADISNYSIYPEAALNSVDKQLPEKNSLLFSFSSPLEFGRHYKLVFKEYPLDCAGNQMRPDTLFFGLPENAEVGDIILNELLHAPASEGVEYVELYNRSSKIIDLSSLRIGSYDAYSEGIETARPISLEKKLFLPDTYVLISRDFQRVLSHYPHAKQAYYLEPASMPSLPNSGGSIALANVSLELLDYLMYGEEMHSPFLRDIRGVSLERIRQEGGLNEHFNWTSAAESSGWGTPGQKNSQFRDKLIHKGVLSVEPAVFSPNNDGHKDFVEISYELEKNALMAQLTVYSLAGVPIRSISRMELLSMRGSFLWDGANDRGKTVESGTYVIVLEINDEDGRRYVLKDAVGVVF